MATQRKHCSKIDSRTKRHIEFMAVSWSTSAIVGLLNTALGVSALSVAVVVLLGRCSDRSPTSIVNARASHGELLSMPPEELAKMDIAFVNLRCAQSLPGADNLDVEKCLNTLDAWAKRVKAETDRHLYRVTDP